MLKRNLIAIAAAVAVCLVLPVTGAALTDQAERGYVSVNGLDMYYEVHGTGEPLVLLHGALTTIESSFWAILPSLAATRQVIAVEQQGHGRTADIDRPLSYEQMADDTAALLRKLEIENADVFGYSDGGNLALQIAIRHPELVRRLAVAAAIYNREGYYPGIFEGLEHATPEAMPTILREAYQSVAPDPENWSTLVAKTAKQAAEFEGWRSEDIASIDAPTLVMVGDSDIVRPEHALEMSRLLPHAQLAVLPGTSHNMLFERPDWVLSMIEAFLNAPMPKTE